MSIEVITSKIIEDGENFAKEVIQQAKSQKEVILKEAKTKASKIKEDALKDGQEEKEKLVERKVKVANIDSKKNVLAQKQEIINQCFDKAIQEILSMKKADYINFYAKALADTGYTYGKLIFNEKEKKEISADFLEAVKKVIPNSKFEIASETREMQGGFYLKDKDIFLNLTIEGLLSVKKEELIAEVANKLFQ